ncbi:unnamed protein product [Linum trigynum]|uniref:Transposase MuDR plant domain-containing protein n=1 Tax=Linum trigynum TaxID=586398 RepID=A0AAV2DYB6_9ROSI
MLILRAVMKIWRGKATMGGWGDGSHETYIDDAFDVHSEDDVYDSHYLGSIHSSDDEEEVLRVPSRPRYPEFNPEKDMSDPHFCLHQNFMDFDTYKDPVKNYSIKSKHPLKFKHSDSKSVQVVCQTGCPWNIWGAPTNDGKAIQTRSCSLKHGGLPQLSKELQKITIGLFQGGKHGESDILP